MLTSELDAVNTMLSTMAFQPVNSMSAATLRAEVSIAKKLLEEIRRDVLTDGWGFNSDSKVVYIPSTGDGRIRLSHNVLHIDTTPGYNTSVDIVQRGEFLYDRKNLTYSFTEDITCDQVIYMEWRELPEVCRRYIMVRAARIFVNRMDGTQAQHAYNDLDEKKALFDLRLHHTLNADTNFVANTAAIRRQSVINRVR